LPEIIIGYKKYSKQLKNPAIYDGCTNPAAISALQILAIKFICYVDLARRCSIQTPIASIRRCVRSQNVKEEKKEWGVETNKSTLHWF